MKKSTTRMTVILICVVVGVVAYYAYLSGQSKESRREASMSAAETVLSRNLEMDYPSTPKEVIKYYNEILKCFYNEECTEEEIEDLGNKARELYDEELLENNELAAYHIRLKEDINTYRELKRKITSASVAASTNVDRFEEDDYSFARIHCGYNIMEGGISNAVNQVYLLRRDENKRWKIYGWDLAGNVNPGGAVTEEPLQTGN